MFLNGAGLGPFLYCDYWASVLNLEGVVSPSVLDGGRLSLRQFRRAVDRPGTRLPKFRYYMLAFIFLPVLLPYRVVYDLMRLFRGRAERVGHPVDQVLSQHRLELEPREPGWVRVEANGARVADRVIDPAALRCEVSLFYPTYKLLIAGILSLVFSAGVLPYLVRVDLFAPLAEHLSSLLYVLLAGALLAVLRDPLTAFVAPLPVLAFHFLWVWPESLGGLFLVCAGFILLFFLVEWFLIPRGLPPTLFLYVNDRGSPGFPYAGRHEPHWVGGRSYWVWRFVTLVPGELHKFWERDWERVECWVRADGPEAGRLEWVVGDCHYRELWYRYERLASPRRRAAHARGLEAALGWVRNPAAGDRGGAVVWVLQVDMDPIFHAPYVRGIFLVPEANLGWLANLRGLLASLWGTPARDRFSPYAARVEELEADGTDLCSDIPEHFRHLAIRRMVGMPWSYWRYPLGAAARARRYLYGRADPEPLGTASNPDHQIKEPRGVMEVLEGPAPGPAGEPAARV